MKTAQSFFEDMTRLASGAAGTMAETRREVESYVQTQVEKLLKRMDMVTREEFETVRAMAAAAREENIALKARLDALEGSVKT